MGRHIVQRLLLSVPVLFGVLLIGFLLLQVVPTDPAVVLAGPMASQDIIEAIRRDLGLNEPLWYQFGLYITRVLQGDLGKSIISNLGVAEELARTMGPTLELLVACLVWAIPLGIAMGTLAAVHRGKIADRIIMAISVAGVSIPVFFLGLVLIWYLGYKLQWLPFTGRGGPLWSWDGIMHLILPAITLGGVFVGPIARMTRTTVLEVLGADYVRTARAKGLTETRVVIRHALRNALIPIVTLIGLQIGFLLGGAVVTETMFSWPGVGRLAVGAILSRDFPVAQGAIIVLALAFLLINLAVDVLYAFLDPRVQKR
ncbi:peptide/nickel transport system permease protein/glutathione transport system permease protein/oligopeptide transport system permease protein [Stella humosa]|uniref:Glutathione transport system permease protein GsiC n=1 Tax=Stella humosa TaxID=94 RepID=A0A3N1KV32_9PROT|nr:ABC transporter permease [Stella humosa]ROP81195.1 peptide/nickel transport system permease protein/glutathione transport system permease protein/oligopeptide transport system permease protein [Stella humosa]BBK32542.1 glutathione transport system permease protein GsiC [Stella humosa]